MSFPGRKSLADEYIEEYIERKNERLFAGGGTPIEKNPVFSISLLVFLGMFLMWFNF